MIHTDELSVNARGGTEIMKDRLQSAFETSLKPWEDKVQIVLSRERELIDGMPAIFWAHDIAEDPEAINAMGDGGWEKYAKIVFVSYWQREIYMERFKIPYSKTAIIANVVDPFENDVIQNKTNDTINLIYTPTPHRGLDLLYHAFNELCKHFDNVHLDVFSSFELYGWGERDKPYEKLFDALRKHPNITYHGTQPNEVVREKLKETNIFAYPSTWKETSCISVMEAMASGNLVVSSDLAAIPETTFRMGYLYPFHENPNKHVHTFYAYLFEAVQRIKTNYQQIKDGKLHIAKSLTGHYSNENFVNGWGNILTEIFT